MSYANIVVETHDRVGLIRLNRPQRMNALNDALAAELSDRRWRRSIRITESVRS